MLERTNINGLYRNPKTGVLLNGNQDKLEKYKLKKQQMRNSNNQEVRVNVLEKEVEDLKKQVQILTDKLEMLTGW